MINDPAFFEWLEENGKSVIALESEALAHAVETSCKAKAAIVEADEKEGGQRALLNLGHTFGHALEAAAGYDGSLLHGEAVSVGMLMAFDLSVAMGLCPEEDYTRVERHFEDVGLPSGVGVDTDIEQLIETMKQDKKVKNGKMTFILSKGIGKAFITQDVEEEAVRETLVKFLANS